MTSVAAIFLVIFNPPLLSCLSSYDHDAGSSNHLAYQSCLCPSRASSTFTERCLSIQPALPPISSTSATRTRGIKARDVLFTVILSTGKDKEMPPCVFPAQAERGERWLPMAMGNGQSQAEAPDHLYENWGGFEVWFCLFDWFFERHFRLGKHAIPIDIVA